MEQAIFYAIGGLGLFLYGMTQLSDGLQNLAGSKLRTVVRAASGNRIKALLLGAGVTCVIQSSSITTVMLAGLLNAGVMTLKQSIGVIYGANIGTTITAQIIAFKVSYYALPMIALGFVLQFASHKRKIKMIGQATLALGLIFLGLKYMKDAFHPLRSSEAVMEFTAGLSQNPVLAILCGLILTVIVQSSSGSIGITIAMAAAGLIDFQAALYILLGDNIGTTVTAWLASIGGSLASRRMALCHTMFNIVGAIYFGFIVHSGLYPALIENITPGDLTTSTIARHIANAHTFFNIGNAIILFAFIPIFAWIATKVFRGEEHVHTGEKQFIDDHLLETPEVAVEQLVKELHHMTEISKASYVKGSEAFFEKNMKRVKEAKRLETAVDTLQKDITLYIVKICARPLTENVANRMPSLLHSVNDIEKISDYAENIADMANKRNESNYQISEAALKELKIAHEQTLLMFDDAIALLGGNGAAAEQGNRIFEREDQLDEMKRVHIAHHVKRLKSQECHPLAGLAFVAYHNYVEKIGDHLINVAQAAIAHFEYGRKRSYQEGAKENQETTSV